MVGATCLNLIPLFFQAIQDERMNNHLMEKHGGRYDDEKNTIFVDLNNC